MDNHDKYNLLNPLRYAAGASIAIGGLMHGIGLISSVLDGMSFAWWFWMIFVFAIPAYLLSAVFIFMNWRLGYVITLAAPIIGGVLVLIGFIFPGSGLLILIPGTYSNEITMIGFTTLISEPVAATFCAFLIYHKVWELTEP